MASIPPRKMQSILFPAEAVAYADAQHHHAEHDDHGGDDGEAPIFTIFLNEKSRPSEKRVKMTPMSAQVLDIRLVDYRHGVGHVWTKPGIQPRCIPAPAAA